MSLPRLILGFVAALVGLGRSRSTGVTKGHPFRRRILVIRRNRMGDMICTLPLLQALRRHDAKAHIAVACEAAGQPIAASCPAVDEVILLKTAWNPWLASLWNAFRLRHFDCVIAAKGGFDQRLAVLVRLTGAPVRVGFETRGSEPSHYYTNPVELPPDAENEHQVETLLRLLQPLGVAPFIDSTPPLCLPEGAQKFAERVLAQGPLEAGGGLMLINLSSTAPLGLSEDNFAEIAVRVIANTDLSIGLVAAPHDQSRTRQVATRLNSGRVAAIATPGPLELAALFQRAGLLLTPEGGAAHLAAAMGLPAVVLWSEGPFNKWHSRGENHAFVHAEPGTGAIPVQQVWQALEPYLVRREGTRPLEQMRTKMGDA